MKLSPTWLHYAGLFCLAGSGACAKLALAPTAYQTTFASLAGGLAFAAYACGAVSTPIVTSAPSVPAKSEEKAP